MEHTQDIYAEIERIYPASHEETKATTNKPKGLGVTQKRLKSVNHLHHEGSQLVQGPLALIGEALYRVWVWIRNGVSTLNTKMFPRRDIIYGTRNNGRVVGFLTFGCRDHRLVPLHHMRLELWGRTKFGGWRKLSEGFAGEDGLFALPFDMVAVHRFRMRSKVYFEIHHTGQYIFEGKKAIPKYELYKRIKIPRSSLTGLDYDLGHMMMDYWEYRKDTPLPRVKIKNHDKAAPQKYPPGRIDAISEQFIPIEMITMKHLEKIRNHPDELSIEDIQEAYPENLTACMDKSSKIFNKITRSDAWFGMRMMNGMYANTFDKDPDNPDLYWVHYHWSTYDHTDDYLFPDVTIKLKLLDNGYLTPVEIRLRGKLSKNDNDTRSWRSFTPADGGKWEAAKRIARVSGGLATEIDKHFAETHVNAEQFAIAAYRNLRQNPIGAVLFPHLKEVILINHTADKILISDDGYIARATAITKKGMSDRVADVMGTLDWKNWQPMQPISEKHTYARVANSYWELLNQYIGEFIAENEDEIKDEWHEIHTFSKDLVEHSVPRFVCSWLEKNLGLDSEGLLPKGKCPWYDRSGRMDLSISRSKDRMGKEKAISYLTQNSSFVEGEDDLDELRQLCAYAIWQATFGHYWANSKQYDDIGEVRYCSLGIRFGDSELGALGDEMDDSIAPDKKISTQMMWWSNMLSRTGYGFIMSNEDKDIPPRLMELLKEREQEFAELDIDIRDIQSRTNI